MDVQIPKKAWCALQRTNRYIVLYGGRGSAKSWSVARFLVAKAISGKFRILCTREMQASIRDSVHRLLADQISALKLSSFFEIKNDSIVSKTGSEFLFKGLYQHFSELKSLEGINYVWAEESEKIIEESWQILIPTIRADDSQLIIVFNPDDENSPTYKRFIISPPPDCYCEKMNYRDNPWFPEVLRKEMEHDKKNDFEKYNYIWEGNPKKYGQAVIFKNKIRIEEFDEPNTDETQLYFGADWGFATDPTCLIRCFIKERKLYIEHEFYGYGIEIDDLPKCFKEVPRADKWTIMADSARPDTISYMNSHGYMVQGAKKGAGTVEEGIEFLKNFEAIIIHPRCKGSIDDFSNYRYKTDKTTGAILPIALDKSNHACDAVRYAMEHLTKAGGAFVMPDWDVIGRDSHYG